MPKISPEQVRKASNSFKAQTCALGGIHPRHIALLGTSAIWSLITIFEAAEAVGFMPPQLFQTFIALIQKPTGGTRPIGWFQSILRVWMKVRTPVFKEWESKHARGFAAGKGSSAIDVVWRHTAQAEAAKAQNHSFVCVLWDIRKCYDMMQHPVLYHAARQYDYPLALLRITVAAYRAPRRILLDGLASREIVAQNGIIAGLASATTELRLMLMDCVTDHYKVHTAVNLNIYVDDIALDTTAPDSTAASDCITAAARDFAFNLQHYAQLVIAKSKTAVVSNTSKTASAVRRRLAELGGKQTAIVRSLGSTFGQAAQENGALCL